MLLQDLQKRNLIQCPSWLPDNTHYLTIMGSQAYGVAESDSDFDLYGWAIPEKETVFPHLNGEIQGFGKQKKRFGQWQQPHVVDGHACGGKGREYDFQVFNIIKYFQLLMDNNPNILDSLFVRRESILHITQVGEMVRENRKMFVHRGCFHRLKGYSYAQLSKMKNVAEREDIKNIRKFEEDHNIPHTATLKDVVKEFLYRRENNGCAICLGQLSDWDLEQYHTLFKVGIGKTKRFESQKIHNTDLKFSYHILRLIDECEQLLTTGEMDIQHAREQMKSVRRGEVPQKDIEALFRAKEKTLESLYEKSPLPYGPDETKIKALLLKCLEHHYGSLDKCVITEDRAVTALREIREVVEKYHEV